MRVVGFRHAEYGNECSACIAVYEPEIDDDEKLLRALASRTEARIVTLENSCNASGSIFVKPDEFEKLVKLRGVLAYLRRECKHRVFNDAAGFPYGTRTCAICDIHMGSV